VAATIQQNCLLSIASVRLCLTRPYHQPRLRRAHEGRSADRPSQEHRREDRVRKGHGYRMADEHAKGQAAVLTLLAEEAKNN